MLTRPVRPTTLGRCRSALSLAGLLLASVVAAAGPKVLEETARIAPPDTTYVWPIRVAVDGDWLLATGRKHLADEPEGELVDSSAWLFRRQSNGQWTLVRRLFQDIVHELGDEPLMQVDMDGGVAVFIREGRSWIFERSGTNWTQVPSPIGTDGMDVEIQGGTIAVTTGHCSWSSAAWRKGSDGVWKLVRSTPPGEPVICENEDTRGDVGISGSAIIVATFTDEGPNSARIFEGPFGTPATETTLVGTFEHPIGGQPVAIDLPSALVSAFEGVAVFTRDASGAWNRNGSLLRPDVFNVGFDDLRARGGRAISGHVSDATYGLRSGSVSVFQRKADGKYRYAARLLASDRRPESFFGNSVDISGSRVVTVGGYTEIGHGKVYVFDLPASLTENGTRQDNFEDGSAADWTQTTGSSFTVAATSTSRVFRQLSDTGNSAATLNGTDWTNQSVVADIRPTAYAAGSGDRWFGVVARYTDVSNYYYVTLRKGNTAQLKKIVNGAVATLGSASLPITLNRSYRVRLEVIGTRLRLYVDGQLLAEASDSSLPHGLAGVMMFRTKADYDNVLVSANPQTTLARHDFRGEFDSGDILESTGTWIYTLDPTNNNNVFYSQTDTTGGARLIAGLETDDQVVTTRVRRTAAAGTTNWFGLATRYRDAGNYYYVTLRNNNTVSLRKLVNGAIVELDSAPFVSTTNTWYRVRFEAVRNQLRVYVNDVLRLDAVDSSHTTGRYGAVTSRTAAQYDYLIAVQP